MQPGNPQKIIIICGPTGIGKTSTAIQLSQEFSGEIISADSMQIYREMDIGTAKPTQTDQELVPHHMINVVHPDEPFDAATFIKKADSVIRSLIQRNRLPFIVGGTGLYIKALIHGLFRTRPADKEVMSRFRNKSDQFGSETLHKQLKECDPQAAARIHPNDAFRIIRALEIFEATGKPISTYHDLHRFSEKKYHALKIGLSCEREALYALINQRVDIMLDQGLLGEVEQLLNKGYPADLKSMQSLGYRHMTAYLTGKITWDEAVNTMKRDTRRYAKRQMTWFKADPEIKWYAKDRIEEIRKEIRSFLL
ncbi:MAG: tRNA (adenosine(37)-N6)-dimethylallyltransferase MiaA [Desulfobacterium sp.]|nr:tRNA (adenosine(37)-N6)-dimethylallyltransferase MiaA [Desulfobacterium sp.]